MVFTYMKSFCHIVGPWKIIGDRLSKLLVTGYEK